jgi:thioredoxin 1
MKKLFLFLLPLLAACHTATKQADANPTAVEDVSITTAEPDPNENLIIPAGYAPKLEAIKWKGMKEMTDETFKTQILQSSTLTLVDFNATWCGPCKQLKPSLAKLVKEYDGKINFASVDVDRCPQTASAYRIQAIPTLAFYQNAQQGGTLVGLYPYDNIKAAIDSKLKQTK